MAEHCPKKEEEEEQEVGEEEKIKKDASSPTPMRRIEAELQKATHARHGNERGRCTAGLCRCRGRLGALCDRRRRRWLYVRGAARRRDRC